MSRWNIEKYADWKNWVNLIVTKSVSTARVDIVQNNTRYSTMYSTSEDDSTQEASRQTQWLQAQSLVTIFIRRDGNDLQLISRS